MENIVIVSGCRTAVGKFGGTLKSVSVSTLAETVMTEAINRAGITPDMISEIHFGQCRQSSDYSNLARYAALAAKLPETIPAFTEMCACSSGMLATREGMNAILAGQSDIALVGGAESMSNAPYYTAGVRWGLKAGNTTLKDSLTEAQINSQPQDIYGTFGMGITAENIAEKYSISREEQDQFACESQAKAADAIKNGKFKDEIVALEVPQGKKKPSIIFDTDEFPRETTMEGLAKLAPVFKEGGTVTAGNSSGRNDGASAMIIMTETRAKELGLTPIARIRGIAAAGLDPRYMGLGPVFSTKKVLEQTGLTLDDIQLIELNEAFAAQSLGCIKELGLENKRDIINVNGGAIALGHPIGSSGSRIMITLMYEMKKRGLSLGLATLCAAGGLGTAAVIEMI